jgi:cell division protein FtsB
MNSLPLPTDNLYKFIALTGLTLVVLSILFPIVKLNELEVAVLQTQTKRKVLEIEIKALEEDFEYLSKSTKQLEHKIDLLDKSAKSPHAKAKSAEPLRAKSEQLESQLEDLKERRRNIAIKKAEQQGQEQQGVLLLKQISKGWSLFKVVGILGLVITHFGFFLWYRRVQIPADEQAKQKASKSDT